MNMLIDLSKLESLLKKKDLLLLKAFNKMNNLKAFEASGGDSKKMEPKSFDYILLKQYINSKKMPSILAGWYDRNFVPPEIFFDEYSEEPFFGRPMGHIIQAADISSINSLKVLLMEENEKYNQDVIAPYRLSLIAVK